VIFNMLGSEKQNNMFKTSKRGYVQKNHPYPITSCGRRRPFMMRDNDIENSSSPLEKRKRKKSNEPRKTTKGKGRNFRRKNPGSKLKTAVTGKVKPGSKAAKRRKSFCARSKGWTGERGKAARRRWKC
jgi:hypothetical protein